jgi:hypothetical protein
MRKSFDWADYFRKADEHKRTPEDAAAAIAEVTRLRAINDRRTAYYNAFASQSTADYYITQLSGILDASPNPALWDKHTFTWDLHRANKQRLAAFLQTLCEAHAFKKPMNAPALRKWATDAFAVDLSTSTIKHAKASTRLLK